MHATVETRPQPARRGDADAFEIRYVSLFREGRALAFPCDAHGRVDCDALSERARLNYIFARAMVGREFALPAVLPRMH